MGFPAAEQAAGAATDFSTDKQYDTIRGGVCPPWGPSYWWELERAIGFGRPAMRRRKQSGACPSRGLAGPSGKRRPVGLRIIGGRFRGRRLSYSGQWSVRPMKDRLREAVFDLLGPAVEQKQVIDLFAGTGALGLEALSRGAARALFIEQHHPTAEVLRQNIAALGVLSQAEVFVGNAFLTPLWQGRLGPQPWLVFCSPPYAYYVERASAMRQLLHGLWEQAPPTSLFVVESDARFDPRQLPEPQAWDVRHYRPAQIAVGEKPSPAGAGPAPQAELPAPA